MNLDALGAELAPALEGRVERDHPLASLTTYRLGGPAALYVEPAGEADLEAFGRVLKAAGYEHERDPLLVVGRGSNLLVADEGFPGIVVRMGQAFSWTQPGSAPGALSAGAATPLPLLANWAARRGLAGLEFAVSIPGSVGGGVRMNAGAHGGQLSDCLAAARIFDLTTLELVERPAPTLALSYRSSNLRLSDIVAAADFSLRPDERGAIRERMESFRKHRAATQPGALQNAGSVFKNPPGDSAGRLVEAAGLKGYRVGGAAVSTLHANFFVAGVGASAQDVFDLIHVVRDRVRQTFNVDLEPEIRFVGPFRTAERP